MQHFFQHLLSEESLKFNIKLLQYNVQFEMAHTYFFNLSNFTVKRVAWKLFLSFRAFILF